jgi:hypothetical protein
VLLIELLGRAAFPKPEETQPLTKWTLISIYPAIRATSTVRNPFSIKIFEPRKGHSL